MPESTVVREVKGRIRIDTSDLTRANTATQGFTKDLGTSMGSLSKQSTVVESDLKRLASTHRTIVVPAHEATHGSITKVEESMHHGSIAIGQYGEKWEGLSRRLGGVQGLLSSGLALGLAGLGGAAAAGLGIQYVKSAIENAEAQEKALEALHQSAEVSKSDYSDLKAGLDGFIASNRAYIGDQYEATTALAMFTRGGLDHATALKAMGAALDLANLKGISLADAAHIVQLALNGNGRAVRELGIDLKTLTAEQDTSETAAKALTKAQADQESAVKRLDTAQRALLEFEAAFHAKKTISAVDLLHEEDRKKAVADATNELAAANANLARIQDATTMSTDKQIKVLDEILQRTEGGRSSITKMQQEQNKLHNTWQDLSADAGPQLIQTLTLITGATDAYIQGLAGKSAAGKQSWKDINDLLVDTAHKWHDLFPPTPPTPPTPPLPGAAATGLPPGVPGHPDMSAETAHQLGLLTLAELAHNVITQRATENQDRFGAAIARSATAAQRAGEITDTTTGLYDSQKQELGRMTGHSNALRDALYDQEVAQGSLQTRIHEVITSQRDESDEFTRTGQNSRNQLAQTQAVYDGFVAHINSEHLDAAKIYVDYSDVIAAEWRWNNLLYNVAVHRGELQANFVVNRIGSQGNLEGLAGGGRAIPGHIYDIGEYGPETLVMGASGGYVIPHGGGGGSANPASTTIVEIDSPIILDDREVGRFVKRQISREGRGQG